MTYSEFLQSKAIVASPSGMESTPSLKSHLFPFQRHSVEFALRCGSAGLFLSTGLGKTACELEWAFHAAEQSNGRALILTPLAVARQIEAEGRRWDYPIRVVRSQDDVQDGINVCNYDRMDRLDPAQFGAVVLDESSIIKNFTGKTSMALIKAFSQHRWRLSATATPAPNDHQELGTQCEFLGVMSMNDMLVRWFINDSNDTGTWRLKGYARDSYWDWMASWSRMANHPRDLGDDTAQGYDLPELRILHHHAAASAIKLDGVLFASDVSATGIHELKRQTTEERAKSVAAILEDKTSPFIVWVDTDYESDAVKKAIGPMFGKRLVEVKGSLSIDAKEDAIQRFGSGDAQGILTKSSITGWGLNWQHCDTMVFAGRSFSYESWYQAVRRCWRFGQKNPVTVHVVVAEGEDSIGRVLDRKSDDNEKMKQEMVSAMRRSIGIAAARHQLAYKPQYDGRMPQWFAA